MLKYIFLYIITGVNAESKDWLFRFFDRIGLI